MVCSRHPSILQQTAGGHLQLIGILASCSFLDFLQKFETPQMLAEMPVLTARTVQGGSNKYRQLLTGCTKMRAAEWKSDEQTVICLQTICGLR